MPCYRLASPYGQDLSALWAALRQKRHQARLCPQWLGRSAQGLVPLQVASLADLPNHSLSGRLQALLAKTLLPLCSALKPSRSLACFITLPLGDSPQRKAFPDPDVYRYLRQQVPALNQSPLIFLSPDQGPTAFQQAQTWLQTGRFQQIVFGGVDSFISLKSIQALKKNQALRHWGNPEGLLPSEAAAFFQVNLDTPKLTPLNGTLAQTSSAPHLIKVLQRLHGNGVRARAYDS